MLEELRYEVGKLVNSTADMALLDLVRQLLKGAKE